MAFCALAWPDSNTRQPEVDSHSPHECSPLAGQTCCAVCPIPHTAVGGFGVGGECQWHEPTLRRRDTSRREGRQGRRGRVESHRSDSGQVASLSPMKNIMRPMRRTSPRWMTTQSSAHTWPSARLWTKKNWMKRATSLTKWKLYAPFSVSLFTAPSK